MPTYNATPKLARKEVKAAVKDFLISKLGSEEKLDQCTMVASTSGKTFSTYGIPKNMYLDFRNWAVKELRKRFGSKLVKEQPWENA